MATTDKYDRQLRLWGAHGQRALGTAKVCVLVGEGSGALATETLKNLVLPGIGEFIFVDGAVVTERDLGSNFFVEGEALGQSRAECCTRLLKELNPDVQGNYVNESVAKILETKPEFLEQFQLVIACRLDDTLQQKVEEKCRQAGVPVVIQNILGFFGQLRLCLMEHCVVEGKPDNEVVDLRILNPFPQLSELVNKVDLEKMDDAQHAHVPYVFLLMIALERWRKKRGAAATEAPPPNGDVKRFRSDSASSPILSCPKTKEEKDELKAILSEMRRSQNEANFEEALSILFYAWSPYKIPDGIKDAMDSIPSMTKNGESTTSVSSEGYNRNTNNKEPLSDFWKVVTACKEFVSQTGTLPLMGSLPDMVSDTESYIALQQAYNTKAMEDREAIKSLAPDVDDDFLQRFCQNCLTADVFRYRSLNEELTSPNEDTYACECGDEDAQIGTYVAMQCAGEFASSNGRWPGQGDDSNCAGDVISLTNIQKARFQSVMEHVGQVDKLGDYMKEVTRYGGSELHPTAAFLGGVASQEIVKIITKQFTPLNNTFVYNGVTGKAQTLEF